MSETFHSLDEFEREAKRLEINNIFCARIFYKEKKEGGQEVLFNRTIPTERVSIEDAVEKVQQHREAPEWFLDVSELDALAAQIHDRWPGDPWPATFIIELRSGSWRLSYGPDFSKKKEGEELKRVLQAVRAELDMKPVGWRFGDPT